MSRVAAVVSDAALAGMISETARLLGLEPVIVIYAGTGDVRSAAKQAESSGAAVILAPGHLAEGLRRCCALPVLTLSPSPFEVVMALARAKNLGDTVALVHFGKTVDVAGLGSALGVTVVEYPAERTPDDVRRALEQAKQAGCGVVVGGQVTVDLARAYGMKGVAISVGKQSVVEALMACMEIARAVDGSRTPSGREADDGGARDGQEQRCATASFTFDDIPCQSHAMKKVVGRARGYAASALPILIVGEPGTGKEVLAQAIHNDGPRRGLPFVRVGCRGLPADEVERILFGSTFGAADGGTIYLDEVWALPEAVQTRLLEAIDSGSFWDADGGGFKPVRARLMASSSEDPVALKNRKAFVEGLYWRLCGAVIDVPPLRDRAEDIPALFRSFFSESARFPSPPLSQACEVRLRRYDWPGNVRELLGLATRVATSCKARQAEGNLQAEEFERIVMDEFSHVEDQGTGRPTRVTVSAGTLDDMVQEIINQMERAYGGNKSEVARRLGISRTTLWKRLKER